MYEISNWPTEPPTWDDECIESLKESSTSPKPEVNLDTVLNLSEKFPIKFPIDTIRCKNLLSLTNPETLERNIKSAYPLIHESALYLYCKFLIYKRKHGTEIEKRLYKDMTLIDFIQRLLIKRAVMFMGRFDSYILLQGNKGAGKWDTIGKENEMSPLVLQNCISYDEIKLSALLSVSSYNYFINNGFRKNNGIVAKCRTELEEEGIVVGIIGARLKRRNAMEFEEMVISKTQNTPQNGYGDCNKPSLHNVFSQFYQEHSYTYDDVQEKHATKPERFVKLKADDYFDNVLYSKRLALSFDTLLLEANYRAQEKQKSAYIHVVGIGLGVWKASDHQETVFVKTFVKRLSVLGKKLSHVSDVHFAYFARTTTNCDGYKNGDKFPIEGHPKGGIKIHISKREPYTKLGDSGKLLVVSYAWDGNALPGNEFWKGLLGSTGDSSTASSCQVTELHNPHINQLVCADNLLVVTPGGHIAIHDYINRFKKIPNDSKIGETSKNSKRKRK